MFDTVPYLGLMSPLELDGAGHFSFNLLPLVRRICRTSSLEAFMGPFGDYILSSLHFVEKKFYTVAVGLQTFVSDVKNFEDCLLLSRRYPDCCQSVSYSSSTPQKNFGIWFNKWWHDKG